MEQRSSGGAVIDIPYYIQGKIKGPEFRFSEIIYVIFTICYICYDMLYLHTASLKSRCFLFILIILVFILDSSLVRQSFLSI